MNTKHKSFSSMAEMSAPNELEENILYDLTIATEWPQEPEIIFQSRGLPKDKERPLVSLRGRLTSVAYRTLWTFLRSIGISIRTSTPCNLPAELVRLVNSHIHWHLAVSRDGRHLAVLQDQLLEIRTSRDEFSAAVGRCSVATDPYPQWRTVAWSEAGDMVACSGSTGDVSVFDLAGTSIVYIPSPVVPLHNSPVNLSHAVVALIFKEVKIKSDDLCQEELLVVNYQGSLSSYLISAQGTFCLNHNYTFSLHYPHGLSCSVYLPAHDLLVLGGPTTLPETPDVGPLTPADCGLSLWRCLSDTPHYKVVTDLGHDPRMAQGNIVKRIRSITFPALHWRRNGQDGVFHMSCSPDGLMLVAVHYTGTISLWHVPSFRLAATWPLKEQPGYDEMNPEVLENPRLKKQMKDSLKAFHLMDANWWSDDAVILVRGTGALSVSSVKSLRNLLGTSPEWFAPAPTISPAVDGGFMALECEAKQSSQKRRLVEHDDDDYEDSDDELDATVVTKTARYVKWFLHYVTDIERFQPPRKLPKVITKTYRLVNLKSTTPEELFHRKIEQEEYGEALALATVYGLDCDLVYQRQWHRTPVSVASIQDYLSKISKRSWVLSDCMERVPKNIDAMRELLQYGLRGTDLEALQAIGSDEDGGRFILCDIAAAYEEGVDFVSEEHVEEAKVAEAQARYALAAAIDFQSLTLEQRELCRARVKLLQYIDRLSTYEAILGGIHAAEDRFNPKFFEEFRSQNIVELSINYARQCDWRALEVLFTYHGSELLQHRLAILSNFPETFAPAEYRSLLPEAGWRPSDPEVLVWDQGMWRPKDWVELDPCREAINPNREDQGAFLYEDNPDLAPFKGKILCRKQLTEWYTYRACAIERLSRQVEHSLELVRYAMERNVPGLERLCDDLLTMDTLVYECFVDDSITLEDLQAMADLDKLRLLMSTSTETMYLKNVRRWMVPFLERCEKFTPGALMRNIREYLVTLAKYNLTSCRKVFESSKADQPNPVISADNELISMALECIYACESNDQLSNAFGILECLPQRGFGKVSKESSLLHNQVDELESHLIAAETLERHGLPQTIAHIRNSQNDPEEATKLFTKLTRFAGRRTLPLSSDEWRTLLVAMLDLREKVYRCVESSVCYEIYVESLLCSSRPENILLAGDSLERSRDVRQEPASPRSNLTDTLTVNFKVAYPRAVELVLSAAQEYFNSSTALTDNCMELAGQCLNLILSESTAVAEELDLIESLAILVGFGVSMLPLQVRMTTDRLSLIQKAIDVKPFTYKNSQRLLRLARLLRVCGDDSAERKGQVLKLVAQAALAARDHRVAHGTCVRLMEAGYAPVWQECKALAQEEGFTDTTAKVELLSFAVTHCTDNMLEPILRAKCYLQSQILYEELQLSHGCRDSASPTGETSAFSARAAIQQTQEILSATTSTSKKVLSAVSDKRWWTRTMRSLHPAGRDAGYTQEWDDRNASFSRQGCHPFYGDVTKPCYTNNIEADFRWLRLRPAAINGLQFSEAVLRLASLEQMLTEGATENSSSTVLVQLAEDVIHLDCSLGLAYLLALPQPLDADVLLKKLPRTAISLQLATYYYALQLGVRLNPRSEDHQGALYTHDPSDVIATMLAATEDGGAAVVVDLGKCAQELVEKLHHYNELLADFTQAQVLENLCKGVDVARFTQDNEYKKETILGLAMTTEQTVYETALSLATRYKLPLWELYMTHLEHLFDCGLPLVKLEQRVVQQGLLHPLSTEPEKLGLRMAQFVYPSIAGTDHGRLLYYYSLLEEAGVPAHHVTPDTHARLLRKMRPAAPGLDYKKLMDGTARPLEVIRPVLNDGNVHVLAKLAPKIPDQRGGFLQPSLVFCAWAVKLFWGSDKKGKEQRQMTQSEWIHRYETCGEYMQRLNPDDMIQFIEAIVFVPQALDKLELECRQDIVRRSIKFCKQGGKKKKKDDCAKSEATWEDVARRMQESLNHLTHLDNPVVVKLAGSQDNQLNHYARLYDLSRSETHKVHDLCVLMVLDGQPCHLVGEVLSILPGDAWQPQTAVREALSTIITAIRSPDSTSSLLEGRDLMKTLETVVNSVHNNKQDTDLVSVDDVMILLRPFCADVTVPVQPRLDVLHILEQTFELNEGDLILLICYRTDALISAGWHDRKVTEAEVGTDSGRQALFDELLATSSRLDHFSTLAQLLNVWPPLSALEERSEEPKRHPWCQVIIAMVIQCKQEAVPYVLKVTQELKDKNPLSVKCVQFLFDQLVACDMWLTAIKVALISGHTELHDAIIKELAMQDRATDDQTLCKLLLQYHLVARIVSTPYYPLVVNYIISQQTPGVVMPYYLSVETIANQLQELNYPVEAASLLMTYRGTHPMLRTFDMTYGVLERWLDH